MNLGVQLLKALGSRALGLRALGFRVYGVGFRAYRV